MESELSGSEEILIDGFNIGPCDQTEKGSTVSNTNKCKYLHFIGFVFSKYVPNLIF